MIEELTGQKYQDFVEQAIFKAIGMDQSGYFAMNKLPEKTALGYVEEPQGWRTNIYNLPIVGASDGGAFTTVEDIATLWKAFWGYEILPKALVEIYTQPFVKAETKRGHTLMAMGSGFMGTRATKREEFITGADAGFRSSRA